MSTLVLGAETDKDKTTVLRQDRGNTTQAPEELAYWDDDTTQVGLKENAEVYQPDEGR